MLKSRSFFRRCFLKEMWEEEENARLLASFLEPEVPHPEPNAEEVKNTVLLPWRKILRLLTRWDPLIQYTVWLHELEAAMNDRPAVHKIMTMDSRN